ncbi:MAG: hypothetical protein Q7R97_02160 [Candidatus Daviesbacteria bacterium]|nr:hypothetical protein [Candidatus Daviesbacteria bacterium]
MNKQSLISRRLKNKQSFSTNKLIPFKKFSNKAERFNLSGTSVMVNKTGVPLGFVFGRDSFISFLEYIDSEFEKNVTDPGKAFNNPAGKLIDFIEEKLPVKSKFMSDIKEARKEAQRIGWVSLGEIERSLNV